MKPTHFSRVMSGVSRRKSVGDQLTLLHRMAAKHSAAGKRLSRDQVERASQRMDGIRRQLHAEAIRKGLIDKRRGVIKPLKTKWSPERIYLAETLRTVRESDRRATKGKKYQHFVAELMPDSKTGAVVHPAASLYQGDYSRHGSIFNSVAGKRFARHLRRRKGRVLDVGPGRGDYWRRFKGLEVHALNPSVSIVGERIKKLRVGAIETADLGRNKYGNILDVYAGFDKTPHPLNALKKMAVALEKGGMCYIVFGRRTLRDTKGRDLFIGRSDPETVNMVRKLFEKTLGMDYRIISYHHIKGTPNWKKELLVERLN